MRALRCRGSLKKEKTLWKKERLQTIKLLLETELSYDEVAEIVGRHSSRVRKWVAVFREGGIDLLLTRGNGGGRKSLMSEKVQEALIEKLQAGTFRTAGQIEQWLKDEHQLEYGKGSLYDMLGKLGGHLKLPRPSHEKKNSLKEIEF